MVLYDIPGNELRLIDLNMGAPYGVNPSSLNLFWCVPIHGEDLHTSL